MKIDRDVFRLIMVEIDHKRVRMEGPLMKINARISNETDISEKEMEIYEHENWKVREAGSGCSTCVLESSGLEWQGYCERFWTMEWPSMD